MIFFLFVQACSCTSKRKPLATDIDIFESTPIYELALDLNKSIFSNIEDYLNKEEVSINIQEPHFGFTLLHWAAYNADNLSNSSKLINTLLRLGADPNVTNKDGKTPIYYAAGIGKDTLCLKYLVENGAKINLVVNDSHSSTSLMVAAKTSLENTRYLVNVGANVNYIETYLSEQKTYSKSALGEALAVGKLDIVRYLILEAGSDYSLIWGESLSGYKWDICGCLDFLIPQEGTKEWDLKAEILDSLTNWEYDCSQIMKERERLDSIKKNGDL